MLANLTHEYFEKLNETIISPHDLVSFLFVVGIAVGNTLDENLNDKVTTKELKEILELVSNSAVIAFETKRKNS